MVTKNLINKALASCLLVAVWSVSSMVALASVDEGRGSNASITVSGTVSVNDRAAISNSTLVSGNTVTTGESADSIATVDMGKLGRVELLSQSSVVLKFDENGIYATLLVGKVRVMNMAGVTTTVATKEGVIIGETRQANNFTVETECGRTTVNSTLGVATLRADNQDRQVAAGTEAVAGSLQQTGCRACLRPDPNATFPVLAGGSGFLPVLLPILVGVGVGTAIIATRRGNNIETGRTGIVISATR